MPSKHSFNVAIKYSISLVKNGNTRVAWRILCKQSSYAKLLINFTFLPISQNIGFIFVIYLQIERMDAFCFVALIYQGSKN
jgi:hypothetical protein